MLLSTSPEFQDKVIVFRDTSGCERTGILSSKKRSKTAEVARNRKLLVLDKNLQSLPTPPKSPCIEYKSGCYETDLYAHEEHSKEFSKLIYEQNWRVATKSHSWLADIER
jgi:hypothetical protein